MTQHLAMELTNITKVDAVSPDVLETPIYENTIDPEKVHDPRRRFNGFNPNLLLSPNRAGFSDSVTDVDGGVMAGHN